MPSWPADHLWVMILAGGIGSRFWPASTPRRPKQLLPLASDRPLIDDTVRRAKGLVPAERIRVLAGEHLVEPFRAVLDLPGDSYLVEPEARGTAPVLTWAAHTALRADPEAVLVSLHADHRIDPEHAFLARLRDAASLAHRSRTLVTIGAVPDRPETGYGYVQPGDVIADAPPGARRVAAFHEKPDRSTAERYLAEGYLWNTGIFIWRADVFLEQVREHVPDITRALPHLDRGDTEAFFRACPNVSVDVAVLEKSDRVVTLSSTFQWDDVGSWEALPRTRGQDDHDNTVVGDVTVLAGRGNVVYAEGGAVVLYGVDDLVVVRAPAATFVTRRDGVRDLKALLDALPVRLTDPDPASDTDDAG